GVEKRRAAVSTAFSGASAVVTAISARSSIARIPLRTFVLFGSEREKAGMDVTPWGLGTVLVDEALERGACALSRLRRAEEQLDTVEREDDSEHVEGDLPR